MSRFRRVISAALVIVSMIMAAGSLSYAATDNSSTGSGTGYRISPVRTDLTIPRGESRSVRVFIKNVSADEEKLKVLINDFRSDNESGAPALLLNNESLPRHSLKQYITHQLATTALQPGEEKSVDVKITIPNNARPGGYFGAVRFAPVDNTGTDTVNLAANVASLILVTVPGNYKEQISVAGFFAAKGEKRGTLFTSPKDLRAVVRFENTGDVQEQPFGKVVLKKGQATLATYEINDTTPRGNVLPDSIRRFNVNLDKVGNFGKYTIEGNFGYGTKGQLLTAKNTFYVIPLALIIIIVLGLLLLIFLIIGLPRILRNYKRKILRQSRK